MLFGGARGGASPGAAGGYPGAGGGPGLMGGIPMVLIPGIIKGGHAINIWRVGGAGEAEDSHNHNTRHQGNRWGHKNWVDHASWATLWTRGHMVYPQGGGKRGIPPGLGGFWGGFYPLRGYLFYTREVIYCKSITIVIRTPARVTMRAPDWTHLPHQPWSGHDGVGWRWCLSLNCALLTSCGHWHSQLIRHSSITFFVTHSILLYFLPLLKMLIDVIICLWVPEVPFDMVKLFQNERRLSTVWWSDGPSGSPGELRCTSSQICRMRNAIVYYNRIPMDTLLVLKGSTMGDALSYRW